MRTNWKFVKFIFHERTFRRVHEPELIVQNYMWRKLIALQRYGCISVTTTSCLSVTTTMSYICHNHQLYDISVTSIMWLYLTLTPAPCCHYFYVVYLSIPPCFMAVNIMSICCNVVCLSPDTDNLSSMINLYQWEMIFFLLQKLPKNVPSLVIFFKFWNAP